MGMVSGGEHGLPFDPELVSGSKVHSGRRHQAEGGVMMRVAIPVLKVPHPGLGVPETVEAVGVGRVILEGLEAGLGVRVIIRDVGPRGV
jgi:hypothetical protein